MGAWRWGQWRRRACGAALCAAALAWPSSAPAGQWHVLEWTLANRVRQVRVIQWQGAPAVLAVAPGRAAGDNASSLQVLRISDSRVEAVADWSVPGFLRWAEPVTYATGRQGWLALRSDGWYLGQPGEGRLAWRLVCACLTVFGDKEEPDSLSMPFAADMNGDGIDEVVLPDPEGITVYRWAAEAALLEPWWRYRWEEPLLRDPKRATVWQLPKYWLLDTHRGGLRALVLHHADRLAVFPYPGPAEPRYEFTGAARVRLESVPLPPALRRALLDLGNAGFADVEQLLAALPVPSETRQRTEWLATLPAALWAVRTDRSLVSPTRLSLPGAPKLRAGDYAFPVAFEDLTGNGSVDLLQAAVLTDDSALGVRGELRLYEGSVQDGHWAFATPAVPMAAGGASVAELFRSGTGPGAPAALAIATTDVTLGAILRSLSSGKVRLDLTLHVLREGRFDPRPNQSARLVLEGIASGARPLVFAADLDGDGWRELLINRKPDSLLAYRGSASGPGIDAAPISELPGPLPRMLEELFVIDLDGNGREDLVFWYRSGRYSNVLRRTLRFARWVD